MALTADDLINGAGGVRVTLIDSAKVAWSDAELIDYLNEGLTATAFVKPDMYTVQDFVTLTAGIVQNLPDDGIAIMDVIQNSLANGGRVVTLVDQGILDEASRFWPAGTQQAQVEHYTVDPRTPKRFQVYPPNSGDGSIEILYGAVPPVLAADDELPVADSYQTVLKYFMLGKAYAKNSKRQDLAKSSGYMNQWGQLIGVKTKAQFGVSPQVTDAPGP